MDPYSVLGVPRSATDEQIKKVYRDLVKKYHPDKYANSDLAEVASEKLKEINAAYDSITKNRGAAGMDYGATGGFSGGSARYAAVRQNIQTGNISAAESMLAQMMDHDAEWHFLMGVVYTRKGWWDSAKTEFSTANAMDPGNMEYHQAAAQVNNMGGSRDFYGGGGNANNCGCCEICATMACCNMCSSCCCGGCGG